MGKYSKWIGGTLGWAFGGPIGGILGFAFGSMLDGMTITSINQTTQSGDFVASLLVLTAAVMKADKKVMKSELDYVKDFFLRQFGLSVTEQYMLTLREILKRDVAVSEVCMQIKQNMDYAARLQLIHFLFGVAAADGQIHADEIAVVEEIARYLNIQFNDISSIKAMFVKDTESSYKILEISSDATDDEVKKAYRKMAVKYHPDKVSHLGEDMQFAAKEKFQQLSAAYEQIKKQRGIN
ncbi:MAG: TerB family tellurite resistance protein [Bacteroidetes bacterium]|nr:TerB family tellurite resistance protein [Bacteroidota bacterium]